MATRSQDYLQELPG